MKSVISSIIAIAATLPIVSSLTISDAPNTAAVSLLGSSGETNSFVIPFQQAIATYNAFNVTKVFYDRHDAVCVFVDFRQVDESTLDSIVLAVQGDGTVESSGYAQRVDTIYCVGAEAGFVY